MPKNVKGDPLGVFEHPFGDNKKIAKKVSQSRKTAQKKLFMGGTRTRTFCLADLKKSSKKLEAEEVTLVWQLVEASL